MMSDQCYTKTVDLAVVEGLEEETSEHALPAEPHAEETAAGEAEHQHTATTTKTIRIKLLIGLLAVCLIATWIFGPEELTSVKSAASKPPQSFKSLQMQPAASGSKVLPITRIRNILKTVFQPRVSMPVFLGAALLVFIFIHLVPFVMSQTETLKLVDSESLVMAEERGGESFEEDKSLDPQIPYYIGFGCFGVFLLFTIVDMIIYYKNHSEFLDFVTVPRFYFGHVFGSATLAERLKMIIWILFMVFLFVVAPIGFALTTSLIVTAVFQFWIGLVFVGVCIINLLIPNHHNGAVTRLDRLVKTLKRANVRVLFVMCAVSIISSAVGGVFGIVMAACLIVFFTAFIHHFHCIVPSKLYIIPWILMAALQIANIFVAFPFSVPVYILGHIFIYIIFKRVKSASKHSDPDNRHDDHLLM